MPDAFLIVTLVGALGVWNAYTPVRREPFTVVSFFWGWMYGELPLQTIAWQVAATLIFASFGAFDSWEGWLGLGIACASWIGLLGLAASGARSDGVVAAALLEASGPTLPLAGAGLPAPAWGTRWRVAAALPRPGPAVEVVHNVDYTGDGMRRHRADIIRPRPAPGGPGAGDPAPVMVYIHGGAWMIGDKREQGRPMMYELATRGWVCVSINYRLSPRSSWPDHIVDCKRAVAWVKENIAGYGGDPSFVVVSGGSAGGHLSALLALTPGDPRWQPGFEDADTSVAACVPFYGVMDMTGAAAGSGKYGPGLLDLLERRVMKVSAADHPEVFEAASPTYRVHPGAPPFFVLHGLNDTLVPIEVPRRFVAELKRVSRAPVVYVELPRAQHAFDVLMSRRCRATTAGVVAFLEALRRARAGAPPPAQPPPPASRPPLVPAPPAGGATGGAGS